jgi:hypothetical protein
MALRCSSVLNFFFVAVAMMAMMMTNTCYNTSVESLSIGGGFLRRVVSRRGNTKTTNQIVVDGQTIRAIPIPRFSTTSEIDRVTETVQQLQQQEQQVFFDADSYRQQMTNLVYERNMERCL